MTAPTPFPYEDADHQLPTRPPVRRPTPVAPYHPGDPIMRAVLAVWLACAIVALTTAVSYHERSGPWITGAFLIALTASGIGALAYHWTDHKAGQ